MMIHLCHVGPQPPAVFFRSGAPASHTHGITGAKGFCHVSLDPHLVLPPIRQVIFVQKALVDVEVEITQPNVVRIRGEAETASAADAVVVAVNVKPMEVRVGPVKGNLERVMEVGKGAISTDQQTPPDEGAHLANPDMDLVDLDTALSVHQRVSVAESTVAQKREARESTGDFLMPFKMAPSLERSPITEGAEKEGTITCPESEREGSERDRCSGRHKT